MHPAAAAPRATTATKVRDALLAPTTTMLLYPRAELAATRRPAARIHRPPPSVILPEGPTPVLRRKGDRPLRRARAIGARVRADRAHRALFAECPSTSRARRG